MGALTDMFSRHLNGGVRKEDNLTPIINEFIEGQPDIKSFSIRYIKPDWYVDIDGNVHIYPKDVYNGTFAFKLGEVSGDIFSHIKTISPAILPEKMGGEILFVQEVSEHEETTQKEQADIPGNKSKDIEDPLCDFCTVCPFKSESDDITGDMHYRESKTIPTKETIKNGIKAMLWNCENHDIDININDIVKEFEEERKKEYNLIVDIVEEKSKGYNYTHISSCNIILEQDGEQNIVMTEPAMKAMYLTFLLFEDGVEMIDTDKDFLDYYTEIYRQMPGCQDRAGGVLDKNKWKRSMWVPSVHVSPVVAKITKKIEAISPNPKVIKSFSISGNTNMPYKIAASTEELREKIRKYFHLN